MRITKNSTKQAVINGLVEKKPLAGGRKYRLKSHIAICGTEIEKLWGER